MAKKVAVKTADRSSVEVDWAPVETGPEPNKVRAVYEDRLLTLTEAAAQMQRAPSTIKNWIDSKAMDAVLQPTGLFRIYQSTVDFWLLPNDAKSKAIGLLRLAKINAVRAGMNQLADDIDAILEN